MQRAHQLQKQSHDNAITGMMIWLAHHNDMIRLSG